MIAGPLVLFVIFLRPELIVRTMMLILGATPFASVPILGFQMQWLIGLTVIYWTASLLGVIRSRAISRSWQPAFYGILGLMVLSFLSLVSTRGQFGSADDIEFLKWSVAVSLVFVLARQSAEELRRLGRLFVIGTTAAAVYALAAMYTPGGAVLLNALAFIGYQRNDEDSQTYFLQSGERLAARLAGSFVDPNIAAMFFFVGMILAFLFFRGKLRFVIMAILLFSLTLTLSRGGMLAVAVTIMTFLILNRKNMGPRVGLLMASFGIAAFILSVPVTRQRLLSSFGQQDIGATDRLQALDQFPTIMSQDWVWGLGWGRPEFRNAAVSYAVNMVANAPLGVVYRSGLVVGASFTLLLGLCVWAAFKMIAKRTPAGVAAGGMVIGFMAAIQTGYGVVTIMPMTALMSIVLTVVLRPEAFINGSSDTMLSEIATDSAVSSHRLLTASSLRHLP